MMKSLFVLCSFLMVPFCLAEEPAVAAAKVHLANTLSADEKKLSQTYAPEIMLQPGHEFLKDRYGIAAPGSRKTGAKVKREKLVAEIVKQQKDQPGRKPEKVAKLLDSLTYEAVETEEGDFAAAPADPVASPDGKLHFAIKKADVLLKISPPKGDFLYLQLRKLGGDWQVVSEYLD